MTRKKLLAEANRRYPIGTVYWNLNCIGEKSDTYEGAKPHIRRYKKEARIVKENFQGLGPIIAIGDSDGYVYSGGVWAEIVITNPEIY